MLQALSLRGGDRDTRRSVPLHHLSPPVTTILLVVKQQRPDHKGGARYWALGRQPNPGQHPAAPRTLAPSASQDAEQQVGACGCLSSGRGQHSLGRWKNEDSRRSCARKEEPADLRIYCGLTRFEPRLVWELVGAASGPLEAAGWELGAQWTSPRTPTPLNAPRPPAGPADSRCLCSGTRRCSSACNDPGCYLGEAMRWAWNLRVTSSGFIPAAALVSAGSQVAPGSQKMILRSFLEPEH